MDTVESNIKKCKHCAEVILAEAKVCKHCGKKQGTSIWVWILTIPIFLFVIMMIIGANVDPDKSNARDSVDKCWAKYDSLSKDPSVTRSARGFAYEACQRMVRDFEKQYGLSLIHI